ncbi:MAG TPA: sigma-70 family RNA polymerase sigma factor [Beutenbergiaceae bacterium]|nr:sigma-70 family RNA polymerase sigma factor [Beutenbergiaceae bacterium]
MPDTAEFENLTRPYRAELLAHSYRMLASIHDAEDAVQDTYLRAWRGYDRFAGRSSLRTWLYRIATNTCLRALENRGRRAMPTGLGGPAPDPAAHLSQWPELPWLEPLPDGMVAGSRPGTNDPAEAVGHRHQVRLALIATLQHLPPRQRAVLILREVLEFSAAEVAEMLQISASAVHSLRQRARDQLTRAELHAEDIVEPGSAPERELLEEYVRAMQDYDIASLIAVFTRDAIWEMPPFPAWFQGAGAIGQMVAAQSPAQGPGDHLLVPTAANGQPAFGLYLPDEQGTHRAFNVQVLRLTPAGISHVACFFDLRLFARFGLPESVPAPSPPR